jgi:hypothetical protein
MNIFGAVLNVIFKIGWCVAVLVWLFGAYYWVRFRAADYFWAVAWFGACDGFPDNVKQYCRKCRMYGLIFISMLALMWGIDYLGRRWGGWYVQPSR